MAVAALALCVLTGLTIRVVAGERRRRRRLRRCPICDAEAVAGDLRRVVGGAETLIALRCGQCATWRRLVATPWAVRAHDKRLAADRQAIADAITEANRSAHPPRVMR
jgi:hypothetical protein